LNKLEAVISGKRLELFYGNAAADYTRVFNIGDEVTDYRLFSEMVKQGLLGFVTTKTLTNEKREGNPHPRFGWIRNDMGIQSMGLPNNSVWNFPFESCDVPTIVSFTGRTIEETRAMTQFLDEKSKKNQNIIALEFNEGCPNVPGCPSCYKPSDIEHLRMVRENTNLQVFVKIGYFPEEEKLVEFGRRIEDIGINGVTAINSPPGMGIDVKTGKSVVKKYGGVFGVGLKPLALRTVNILHENTNLELIGLGGIYDYTDALEFLMAGAKAVQLCSVLSSKIANNSHKEDVASVWSSFLRIFKQNLENYTEIKSVTEIIGKLNQ
jgi:dihydroorotate dehydrogenase (NAD+) catalytic subunit